MNSRRKISIWASIAGLLAIRILAAAQDTKPSLFPPTIQAANDSEFLHTIKEALTNKSENSTAVLIEELRALIKSGANREWVCGNTFMSPNTALQVEPLSYRRVRFDRILDELLTRLSKTVTTMMEGLLLSEEIGEQDHRRIWSALRRTFGKEFPVILLVNDPSQERNYVIRMVVDSSTEVEVKKGDTLLRIAKKAYPDLSMWSAIDVIAFMNDFHDPDQIKVGTKFRIYPYRILKNSLAAEEGNHTTKPAR